MKQVLGVFNGEIGRISKINLEERQVQVEFDDGKITWYAFSELDQLDHAYSITIHKAQGSEFDVVIMPLVQGYKKMLYRKLVYTGITRSKKMLYLIGDKMALRQAVSNTSSDIRRTTIKDFLENGIK